MGEETVVLELTRAEAVAANARLQPHSHNPAERSASQKLRAVLSDYGGHGEALARKMRTGSTNPELPTCPTCGSDDPEIHKLSNAFDSPADYPDDKLCPDPFHTPEEER